MKAVFTNVLSTSIPKVRGLVVQVSRNNRSFDYTYEEGMWLSAPLGLPIDTTGTRHVLNFLYSPLVIRFAVRRDPLVF